MNPDKDIAKQRSILMSKISDLFTKFYSGDMQVHQFGIKFEEIMDSYDKNVYHNEISVSLRRRLIGLFDELQLNPVAMKHLDDISKEVGIGFNFEDGWYVIGDAPDGNKNIADLSDNDISF